MSWTCPVCTLVNPDGAIKCGACGAAKPPAGWACPVCTYVNPAGNNVCGACDRAKPAPAPPRSGSPPSHFNAKAGEAFMKGYNIKPELWNCSFCNTKNDLWTRECTNCKAWRCPLCTLVNEPGAAACGACARPKPGGGARGGSLSRKTKRRKYTKRRRVCRTRRIKKQNRS